MTITQLIQKLQEFQPTGDIIVVVPNCHGVTMDVIQMELQVCNFYNHKTKRVQSQVVLKIEGAT